MPKGAPEYGLFNQNTSFFDFLKPITTNIIDELTQYFKNNAKVSIGNIMTLGTSCCFKVYFDRQAIATVSVSGHTFVFVTSPKTYPLVMTVAECIQHIKNIINNCHNINSNDVFRLKLENHTVSTRFLGQPIDRHYIEFNKDSTGTVYWNSNKINENVYNSVSKHISEISKKYGIDYTYFDGQYYGSAHDPSILFMFYAYNK